MKSLVAVAAVALMALVAGFRFNSSNGVEVGQDRVEAEVMAWMEDYLAQYTDLDPDPLLDAWLQEDCSSVSFAEKAVTRQELEAQVNGVLDGWEAVRLELLPGSVVDVISADMAVFQGTARQDFTPKGGEPGVWRIHFTFFLNKVNGEWKIKRNHVSGGAW